MVYATIMDVVVGGARRANFVSIRTNYEILPTKDNLHQVGYPPTSVLSCHFMVTSTHIPHPGRDRI